MARQVTLIGKSDSVSNFAHRQCPGAQQSRGFLYTNLNDVLMGSSPRGLFEEAGEMVGT
jgi:hypothetical protein